MITYRREAAAKNMLKDVCYWHRHDIEIGQFEIAKVEISYERIR